MLRDQVQFYDCNRQKALLFCLIFGIFGIHRFYLHQRISGFAYFAFSWTLIPFALCLIDAVFLAHMTDEEFQEEYNEVPVPLA